MFAFHNGIKGEDPMLAYLVLCIAMTGISCILLAYLYLVATSRKNEIPELVESKMKNDLPRRL